MTARWVVLLCVLAWGIGARPALGAQSFDQCQYYVDTVPAMISTPGMWCLRKDLKVTGYANVAINIQASNTTLDCKGFALDGTAIDPSQAQWGIASDQQHDVTIRNCSIRGFLVGIAINNLASRGNSVVNNRVWKSYSTGISVVGDGSEIRDNIILQSGNGGDGNSASGISAWGSVDIVGNLIHGVSAVGSNAIAISANDFTGHIVGNRVRGLTAGVVSQPSVAIAMIGATNAIVRDNDISGTGLPMTAGLWCRFSTGRVNGNVIKGMETPLMECNLGEQNDVSY